MTPTSATAAKAPSLSGGVHFTTAPLGMCTSHATPLGVLVLSLDMHLTRTSLSGGVQFTRASLSGGVHSCFPFRGSAFLFITAPSSMCTFHATPLGVLVWSIDIHLYLFLMLLLRVCTAAPSSMQHFHATPSSVQSFLATPLSWPGVSSQFSGRATPLGMCYTPLSFYLIPPMSEGENYSAFAV